MRQPRSVGTGIQVPAKVRRTGARPGHRAGEAPRLVKDPRCTWAEVGPVPGEATLMSGRGQDRRGLQPWPDIGMPERVLTGNPGSHTRRLLTTRVGQGNIRQNI